MESNKRMADNTGDDGDTWGEIDISAVRKGGGSLEIETTDDDDHQRVEATNGDDVDDVVVVEDDDNDDSSGGDVIEDKLPELEGIETKGAEKRIQGLVHQRRERDEIIAKQEEELKALRASLVKTKKTTHSLEISSLAAQESELKEKVKLAESQYLTAYDNGDKEKLLEAQNLISDAKTDLKILGLRKSQVEKTCNS
jgi:hypothetical protein